jgi:hypothetical protein
MSSEHVAPFGRNGTIRYTERQCRATGCWIGVREVRQDGQLAAEHIVLAEVRPSSIPGMGELTAINWEGS